MRPHCNILLILVFIPVVTGCVSPGSNGPLRNMDILDQHRLSLAATPDTHLVFNSLPGRVVVNGNDGGEIIAIVEMQCREFSERCRNYHRELTFVREIEGNTIRLRFNKPLFGTPGQGNLTAILSVPRLAGVELKLGAGNLNVTDIDTDSLVVDVNAGDVRISLPEREVAVIDLDTGVGDAWIRSPDRHEPAPRSMLVGAQFERRFAEHGTAIAADVQFGSIYVTLTE